MIQFTQEEIAILRDKAKKHGNIIDRLKADTQVLVDFDITIPDRGIATWTHYYYCPEHSVMLKFDIRNRHEHVCPVDGKVFTGEPYDGAWWRIVNGKNAKGCYELGLLWLLKGDKKYLELAKTILIRYAQYYPGYEVHGAIPHNGPGKATNQTLTEAGWIQQLACGYDLIKDQLTDEEVNFIENNLFTVCAEFLVEHRTPQIHNHEVVISGAIGILGILLGREDFVDFAVKSRYGLLYQLENAVLKDFLWFEGTVHYHFFALKAFLQYEKFARKTPYTLVNYPYYREMLKFPLKIVQPDFSLPLLNDVRYDVAAKDLMDIYEFPYMIYGDEEFAWAMNKVYKEKNTDSLETFLYGKDEMPAVQDRKLETYHNADGSGITVFRGNNDRYLLVKHGPFGGEHDHYDKLGICFSAFGNPILSDFGTTGYGAKMHYDYFKNTGTHNTVVINEENQAPVNGRVLRYEERNGQYLLDVEAKWDGDFSGLDSHTRVEWDEESYLGVTMRRIILWCGEYFVEVFKVSGVKNRTIDWVTHVSGNLVEKLLIEEYKGVFSTRKPFKYLKGMRNLQASGIIKNVWSLEKCDFTVYSVCTGHNTVYYGEGPDNPSIRDVSYMINRVVGNDAVFINVLEAHPKGNPVIHGVTADTDEGSVKISLITQNGRVNHLITW